MYSSSMNFWCKTLGHKWEQVDAETVEVVPPHAFGEESPPEPSEVYCFIETPVNLVPIVGHVVEGYRCQRCQRVKKERIAQRGPLMTTSQWLRIPVAGRVVLPKGYKV